jgi:hypothetical protein
LISSAVVCSLFICAPTIAGASVLFSVPEFHWQNTLDFAAILGFFIKTIINYYYQ